MLSKKQFKLITEKNKKEVKGWEKWKQNYIIDSEAFKTGKLIKNG